MKNKLKIAMVGYHNTLPFLFGLEKHADLFGVSLDIPSKCLDYFDSHEVDIALVPVGALLDRDDYSIVTDYCIGCEGEVGTVCVYSQRDISEIKHIYLDQHSRTSQMLTRILAAEKWNIDVSFKETDVDALDMTQLKEDEAVLMIGDKVFGKEFVFAHTYDLGLEWKSFTGLPFAFAVWIARDSVDSKYLDELNKALSLGVQNIAQVLEQNKDLSAQVDLKSYFERYINYDFDLSKKEAHQLFRQKALNVLAMEC